jgi:hypothetical protein
MYILHNDLWLWHDSTLLLGLPVGFSYHIAFCLGAALLLTLLVNYAWPDHLERQADGGGDDDGGEQP